AQTCPAALSPKVHDAGTRHTWKLEGRGERNGALNGQRRRNGDVLPDLLHLLGRCDGLRAGSDDGRGWRCRQQQHHQERACIEALLARRNGRSTNSSSSADGKAGRTARQRPWHVGRRHGYGGGDGPG
ncbi:unnamed protein product, partial [Ectocarpus sp. 12 AP-2014]